MIDDALVLRVERLRDAVEALRGDLKRRYRSAASPVVSTQVRDVAAQLGERWLVEVTGRDDVLHVLGKDLLADLNVEFQRLITFSEQLTKRSRYDAVLRAIMTDFRTRVIVPLKQARNRGSSSRSEQAPASPNDAAASRAFVGQSFLKEDTEINSLVARLLIAFGYTVSTGEKPKADSVSKKVRERIEGASLFVGIFTRRERLRYKREWATSAWVIDEKAYALANRKKLVLLRETGVQSIGGIQGDYEYVEFARTELGDLAAKLVEVLVPLSTSTVRRQG